MTPPPLPEAPHAPAGPAPAAPPAAMTPASPGARRLRPPTWLNPRLLLGLVLLLGSVMVGTKVVADADRSVRVWALTRNVAEGTVLAAADVRPVAARLFDNADRYLLATTSPAGRTVARDLSAGELLPMAALAGAPEGTLVSLPVSALHVPQQVARGVRVDVFATTKSGQETPLTRHVLAAVPVEEVVRPKSGLVAGGDDYAILVRVAPSQVDDVVRALRAGDLDVTLSGTSAASAPVAESATPSAVPSATLPPVGPSVGPPAGPSAGQGPVPTASPTTRSGSAPNAAPSSAASHPPASPTGSAGR